MSRRVAMLAFCAVGLVACGGPKYHYVKSTSNHTFVRLPKDWTLYDEDQLLKVSDESPEAKAQFKQLSWSVAFDAAPKPSLDHVLADAGHPTGLVQVRTLLPEQRDSFSLADLRTLLLPFDPLAQEAQQAGDVEVVDVKDVHQAGGLHGTDLLLNLKTDGGDRVKWRQVALVDGAVHKVHVLAVSCTTDCYDENQKVIDQVVTSWKVKER
jgi:hypothetical protein